LSKNLF